MKHIIILSLIFSMYVSANAQNTFPSSGSVGVGTISPGSLLHVYRNASGNTTPVMSVEDDYTQGFAQMAFKGTGQIFHVGVGNASAPALYANNFFIVDAAVGKPRLVIDNTGTVAVGTNSFNGGGKLTIYPTAADNSGLQLLRLTSTSGVSTANGKVLTVDASGNVILVNDGIGTSGWSATGNAGTNPSTNYIGTTDGVDMAFRTNNLERFRLLSNGNFRIGSGTDKGKTFQVYGTGYFSNSIGIGTDSINDSNYKLFVATGIRTRKVKVDVSAWPDYVFNKNYFLPSLSEVEKFIDINNHLPGVASADQVEKEGLNLGDNQGVLLKKIEELTLYAIDHNKELQKMQELIALQQQQIDELKKQLELRK
ncbi:MAG: hypothetical protein J7497_07170 [Chitinophagaceae bacterium]|nr:hypothetical protein [Chitinophagaceae bacterium]